MACEVWSCCHSLAFKENLVNQCIYLKFSEGSFIILVLFVNDILLASNDLNLLYETKQILSRYFDMKDLGDASFILGIQIYHDRSQGILSLSQKTYIEKVLSKFNIKSCSPCTAFVLKGEKLSKSQCP